MAYSHEGFLAWKKAITDRDIRKINEFLLQFPDIYTAYMGTYNSDTGEQINPGLNAAAKILSEMDLPASPADIEILNLLLNGKAYETVYDRIQDFEKFPLLVREFLDALVNGKLDMTMLKIDKKSLNYEKVLLAFFMQNSNRLAFNDEKKNALKFLLGKVSDEFVMRNNLDKRLLFFFEDKQIDISFFIENKVPFDLENADRYYYTIRAAKNSKSFRNDLILLGFPEHWFDVRKELPDRLDKAEKYSDICTVLLDAARYGDFQFIQELFQNPKAGLFEKQDHKAIYDFVLSIVDNMNFSDNQERNILSFIVDFYASKINIMEEIIPEVVKENFPNKKMSDPKKIFFHHFDQFNPHELWRLFINGDHQIKENGWLDYEKRESGYICGMMNGFSFLKETIGEPLTVDFILQLHLSVSSDKDNVNSKKFGEFFGNNARNFGLLYGQNASLAGVLEQIRDQLTEKMLYNLAGTLMGFTMRASALPEKTIYAEVNKIIANYHSSISLCKNNEEKMKLIIELVTSLERLHPFGDGNCRLFCMLLLNRELIINGLCPVIMQDPNRFDCFSKNELFNEIIKGMLTFNNVKNNITNDLGIQNDQIANLIATDVRYAGCQGAQDFLLKNEEKILLPFPAVENDRSPLPVSYFFGSKENTRPQSDNSSKQVVEDKTKKTSPFNPKKG